MIDWDKAKEVVIEIEHKRTIETQVLVPLPSTHAINPGGVTLISRFDIKQK